MITCFHRDELQEKYENKLTQEMTGPMFEVFSRLMRVMVGKKITVPGSFKKYALEILLPRSNNPPSFIPVHLPLLFILTFPSYLSSSSPLSFSFLSSSFIISTPLLLFSFSSTSSVITKL